MATTVYKGAEPGEPFSLVYVHVSSVCAAGKNAVNL